MTRATRESRTVPASHVGERSSRNANGAHLGGPRGQRPPRDRQQVAGARAFDTIRVMTASREVLHFLRARAAES